jgi:hypothetical protein
VGEVCAQNFVTCGGVTQVKNRVLPKEPRPLQRTIIPNTIVIEMRAMLHNKAAAGEHALWCGGI